MTAKRSDHLKPLSRGQTTACFCHDCEWGLIAPSNGQLSAEHHAKTHHHRVEIRLRWLHIYDGRPESEKSPL